ncbi:MAG TPA: PfkB family carbohydrate kinase [Terriglobia bacterium]|jgi:rfaE bifunctional protein kinase chain/domain|nr:PfkB family carbohydrate kinase [Terriglobia bacterium]
MADLSKPDFMQLRAADRARLLRITARFAGASLVVLGDLVADEFVHGQIARISREAPVLIVKERERRIVPGGGANAANNLADLGVRIRLLGAAGEDETGEALVDYFRAKGVGVEDVLRPKGYRTPTKSRILGALGHGRAQQIVRLDREPAQPLGPSLRRQLTAAAARLLDQAAALLVSDYGYGSTSAREVEWLKRARPAGSRRAPLTLDSRYHLRQYAGVAAATPNEQEIEQAFGASVGEQVGVLHRLAARIMARQRFEALLVTRGAQGMILYQAGNRPQSLGLFGSAEAVDVTGAGDTVIAIFTAALGVGASFLDAARLANCAGGLVVMKSGTATVTASELAQAIRNG